MKEKIENYFKENLPNEKIIYCYIGSASCYAYVLTTANETIMFYLVTYYNDNQLAISFPKLVSLYELGFEAMNDIVMHEKIKDKI